MPTNTVWTKPLLIGVAVVLFLGILWLAAMLVMHLMMMGPDNMAAFMAFCLFLLILVGVFLLVSCWRGVSNKRKN